MKNEILIETKQLTKHFVEKKNLFNLHPKSVKAVDGVNLQIREGEVLGLVGESGCGKSTLGRTILRLTPATGGEVLYRGQDILKYDKKQMWEMRRKLQIIFQDSYSSLNPRMTVEDLVGAPLEVFKEGTKEERRERVVAMLEEVGLGEQHLYRFPHEFSGGQRQRIGIARALILNPDLVVCDEPVSALDVSVRAQVLNLMRKLQEKKGLTYLFISHDLSVVKHISDRVAVMYLGRVVELADRDELYRNPLHPYTQALLSAIPIPDTSRRRNRIVLSGDVPNPYDPPAGCHFHLRCPRACDTCKEGSPSLKEVAPGHWVACHFA